MPFGFSEWVTVVMAVAIALLLLLVVFSGKMPPRARKFVEGALGVGYPAVVGVFFAVLAWTNLVEWDRTSAIGFGLGAVIMLLLTLRGWKRARRLP